MKRYRVVLREVYLQGYYVEAYSKEGAAKLVRDGEGELIDNDIELSHVMEGLDSVYEVNEVDDE